MKRMWKIITVVMVVIFSVCFFFTINNVTAALDHLPKSDPLGEGVKNIAIAPFSKNEDSGTGYKYLINYIDEEGKITNNRFMDSFIIWPNPSLTLSDYEETIEETGVITQEDIAEYLDYEFKMVDKINKEVSNINSENNSNIKINIFLTILLPNKEQTIKTSRVDAIKYFVNQSITKFNAGNYSNLNLVGFYYQLERIYTQEGADIVTAYNNHIHSKGYKSLWVPYVDSYAFGEKSPLGNDTYKNGYINADCSYSSCKEDNYTGNGYGFDYVSIQSGHYFNGPGADQWKEHRGDITRLDFAEATSLALGMGVEVEACNRIFTNKTYFDRYIEFLKKGVQYGWNQAINVYYLNGNARGAISPNKQDRATYELLYWYSQDMLSDEELDDYEYSRDYFSNHQNVSKGKNYTSNGVTGTNTYYNENGQRLTDGNYGTGNANSKDVQTWSGFTQNLSGKKGNIIVDLGQKTSSVSYFGIEFSEYNSSGVYIPDEDSMKVYCSDDGTDYTYVGNLSFIEDAHLGLRYAELKLDKAISAKYVKFEFNTYEPKPSAWVLVSEVTVGKTSTIHLASENKEVVVGTEPYDVIIQTDNVGTLSVKSSNNGVATASLNNGHLVVTPIKTGTSTITITDAKYGTKATHVVNVIDKKVTAISVKTNPSVDVYFQNTESLDLGGGEINVTYNSGEETVLSMLDSSLKVTGFDNSKVGKNSITISLDSLSTSLNVEIVPKIEIKNIDSSTGEQVAGAKLTIYNSTCANLDITNENIWRESFISTTEPYYTVLNIGGSGRYNYCLVQEERADGYKKSIDKVDFVVERKTSSTVEIVNTPILTYIRAVGEANNEVLENIEFELYRGQCNGNEWSKMVSSWVSATDYYHIKGLKNGEYCLVKKRAPSPYTIGDNVDFLINAEGELIINENGVHNKLDVKFNLTKTSIGRIDDKNKYLAGSVIQIINNNSNKVIKEIVTTSGLTEVKGLEHGNYRVVEQVAPDGYTLFDGSIEITISDRDNVPLILISGYKTEVSIRVVDGLNSTNLSGAEFELRNSKNELIDSWVSNTKDHLIMGLSLNEKYTLIQKKTPAGYISSENISFKITENSSSIEVKNDPIEIKILIKDNEDNKFIAGVPFVLKDKNGNIVDSWTSNDFEHIIRRLPVGNYKLIQTDPVEGYEFYEAETDIEIKLNNEDITIYGKKTLSGSQGDLIENPNTNTGNLRLIYLLIIGILGIGYPLIKRKKLKIK